MSETHVPADTQAKQSARSVLHDALLGSLPEDKQQWFIQQLSQVTLDCDNRCVDIAMGLSPRRLGHGPMQFSVAHKQQLASDIPGWKVDKLTVDAVARMLVLTCFDDPEQLTKQLVRLLRHADLNEQLALYKALPLYPASEGINNCLADGLRSNISSVFEAIAHNNPYPAWHLDTHRFNHLVLKALFIGSSLTPIVGLQQRNNAELARILMDTARERLAASRSVSPELWDTAMPFMSTAEKAEFNLETAS